MLQSCIARATINCPLLEAPAGGDDPEAAAQGDILTSLKAMARARMLQRMIRLQNCSGFSQAE